jgi:ribosomal protein S9
MASNTKAVYVEGIGRRKTATARVRLVPSTSATAMP